MIMISHRGLLHGPDVNLENTPAAIDAAIKAGYSVEIDIWYKNGKYWLGHLQAKHEYELPINDLDHYWFHARNREALIKLVKQDLRVFWHQTDQYALTSWGDIFGYAADTAHNIILIMSYKPDPDDDDALNSCRGICSPWISNYRNYLP